MEGLTQYFPCPLTDVKQMYRNQLLTLVLFLNDKKRKPISKRKSETG